ncbi:MAG: serine/threonine protein kinase, partial [Acidobacteriota bacterium]|nr:serine/threonine protein kinase [Acidobacteriota bacterium]
MAESIPQGKAIGRYIIERQLGAGGMGEVYLALDTQLERLVALKILPAEMAADRQRMNRFIQEAKTASALNQPNILTVFEVGETDSTHFIATEFIDGETLRQHMAHKRLSLREALDIAMQVSSALSAAHKAGIVHRDIKPENIMVRHDDAVVKVLDFGLAKPTERLSQQTPADSEAATRALVNTNPGVVMGTVGYMSPEQARGLGVDWRTDIWSLGCVLYEMVAGRLPFEGPTSSDVISNILQKEPPALTLLTDEANERLDEIVAKALTKDKEERYQSAKDLFIDLKRMKQHLDVEAEIERTVPPEFRNAKTRPSGEHQTLTAHQAAARTATAEKIRPTSSAEYIVSGLKRHKRAAVLVAASAVLSIAAAILFL